MADEPSQATDRTPRYRVSAPRRAPIAGIVVFHPWWGLNDDVLAYSDRLAGAGFAVASPDLYGGAIATTIEDAERLSGTIDDSAGEACALAALEDLTNTLGGSKGRIGAIGFSMGAPWAIWLAAQRPAVDATVVYYGTSAGPSLARSKAPVLGHFAEHDAYEPEESIAAFAGSLKAAGRTAELHRYPGTSHWFAEPSRPEYEPAAAELAYARTVAFLRQRLVGPVPGA